MTGFDLAERTVAVMPGAGEPRPRSLDYDTLIVAGGSRYSYFGHDEWRATAPEVKSLESALAARARLLSAFEAAEMEPDEERRRALLTFVVVGAGPTGVEMAGQIAELANEHPAEQLPLDRREGGPGAADRGRRPGPGRPFLPRSRTAPRARSNDSA